MNLLIAGVSGFIGHALYAALNKTHHISTLGREKTLLQREFPEAVGHYTWDELSTLDAKPFDVVINLCGLNIAASRWTPHIKQQLIDSRVKTTETLINWLMAHNAHPRFFCANAVGIYGVQAYNDTTQLTEATHIETNPPKDFLSEIGVRWQAALQPAIDAGMPVVSTRFGVVLKKGEGMLQKLFFSFYLGLGATIGSGLQTISWVHIDDVVGGIAFLLENPTLTGAFNLTSPHPVSQAEFAETLAHALHRPRFLNMPSPLVRLLFGEMGESLLLKGQRVLPERLTQAGYTFQFPTLSKALSHEF